MAVKQLLYLLPCRSLENLTLRRPADEAGQLLAAWTGLWHPLLLDAVDGLPQWAPEDEPPQQPLDHLVVIPPCCEPNLPPDWLAHAEADGVTLIRQQSGRRELVSAALNILGLSDEKLDGELVRDFHALGYCHFLTELLTRQLRYSSNLDEATLRTEALAAARAAIAGEPDSAREALRRAFDVLLQAREYFYPVETHLLDLTVVADTTLGESLRGELRRPQPTNLLLSGETLERMAATQPETLALLREAVERGAASIIGGERHEGMSQLLPAEAVWQELRRGEAAYREHLGTAAVVYGRRRFGLTPLLPAMLLRLGFTGAIHSTLDDGRFPINTQSRIQWEGIDGSRIESASRVPVEVHRADVFFMLPERLGNAMDSDHLATLIFAHWPGQTSDWYEDLRRLAGYNTLAGTFSTANNYFTQAYLSGQPTRYTPDQYRDPFLRQQIAAAEPAPLARWVAYYQRRARIDMLSGLRAITAVVRGTPPAPPTWLAALPSGCAAIEDLLDWPTVDASGVDAALQADLDAAVAECARALGATAGDGLLELNPLSFPRQVLLDTSNLARSPAVAPPILAAAEGQGRREVLMEVPAMGFAQATAAASGETPAPPAARGGGWWRRPKAEPPIVEGEVLTNEFFQVVIDRHGGGIRSVLDGRSRGPRLAQQLAMRLPGGNPDEPGHESHYSIAAADDLVITQNGPLVGEIATRGRLMSREGQRVGGFRQLTRVVRGSRIIEIDIELEVERPVGSNPWASYYASRFAWSDEAAEIDHLVHGTRMRAETDDFEAPLGYEIRSGELRTAVLTGGLPYHIRRGGRRVDTLLHITGESMRSFSLAVGIDVPNLAAAAWGHIAPHCLLPGMVAPSAHGWLFHIDARNCMATAWEPVVQEGRVTGLRVRLFETDGRATQMTLRAFRAIRTAVENTSPDRAAKELAINDDRVRLELPAHGWKEVDLAF